MATVISDINIVDTENSFKVVNVSNRNLTMTFSVKVGEIGENGFHINNDSLHFFILAKRNILPES